MLLFTQPDVDVSLEGHAGKVSRKQAKLELKSDGCFYLRNLGARLVYVNNMQLKKVRNQETRGACGKAPDCLIPCTLALASELHGGADRSDAAAVAS